MSFYGFLLAYGSWNEKFYWFNGIEYQLIIIVCTQYLMLDICINIKNAIYLKIEF